LDGTSEHPAAKRVAASRNGLVNATFYQGMNTLPKTITTCKYCCWTLGFVAVALFLIFHSQFPFNQGDFLTRYDEMSCLRDGIAPFDVFSGKAVSEKYVTYLAASDPVRLRVHNNPPWTYGMLLWISYLPRTVAATLFSILNFSALAGLFLLAWRHGSRGGGAVGGLFAAMSVLLCGLSLLLNLYVGNFGIIAAMSALAMAVLLEKHKDGVAGIFLALVMLKAQIGGMFILPLLFSCRFKTLAVGGAICCMASCLPCLFVDKMPWDMILDLSRSVPDRFISPHGGGLFSILSGRIPAKLILGADAVVCFSILGWTSWKLAKSSDWLLKFIPSAVLTLLWTYSHVDQIMLALPLIWFAAQLAGTTGTETKRFLILGLAVFSTGLVQLFWVLFVASGRLVDPRGLGWMLVLYLFVSYCFWIGTLIRLSHRYGASSGSVPARTRC
jgi:hypothetical protein